MKIPLSPTNFINPSQYNKRSLVDDYDDAFLFKKDGYYERSPIGFKFSERKAERIESKYLNLDLFGMSYSIPNELYDLVDEINDSKSIVDMEDNWDGFGAVVISKELYVKAIDFLLKYTIYIYDNYNKTVIQSPEINPCVNGTIDFSWRTAGARMLINVKKKKDIFAASFYGYHTDNKLPQEGLIDMNKIDESRALWMKELK